MKRLGLLPVIVLVVMVGTLLAAPVFSQEIPKPGTVIDKKNYKKYAQFLPEQIHGVFEDGWGGLVKPAVVEVVEPKVSYHLPKSFVALSAANKGKYSLDSSGNIVGGWQRNGMPFPDLQKSDKDFVVKLMWNYAGRYISDEQRLKSIGYIQRKGESVRWTIVWTDWLFFTNRSVTAPKPIMKNPGNVAYLSAFIYKEPEAVKNMQNVGLRYMDTHKADETYVYLPNLRRVLRGDSGQRSVPLQGSLTSLDDMALFDGRTNEFTYKLVGEQKILAGSERPVPNLSGRPEKLEKLAFPGEYSTVRDTWVVDIVSKDQAYPQSKKRIWLDKESYWVWYAVVWDRAGKLWKFWAQPAFPVPVGGGDSIPVMDRGFGMDVQLGLSNIMVVSSAKINKGDLSWEDCSPAAMVKKGR